MNDKIENKLLKLLNKASKSNEIPVAAIIEKNGKIISCGYNKRVKKHDVTSHAEIIAIRKAEKKVKDWRLNGYNIHVTLEPCSMCKTIIKESRLDNCFYYVNKPNSAKEYAKTNIYYKQTNYSKIYEKILQKMFKKIRK